MGAWKGVAMDSPKFHPSPPCLTHLRPAGGPPCFFGGPPPGPSSTLLDTIRHMPMHPPVTEAQLLWLTGVCVFHKERGSIAVDSSVYFQLEQRNKMLTMLDNVTKS
jgi:hypothetical protein